jgi:predicted transcriptional regulator
MKLSCVIKILECEVLYMPDDYDPDITNCLGSDMMSDVLAFAEPGALMVTGLVNSQSVRTADIADSVAIVYVRGKRPDEQTVSLAESMSIPLLATKKGLFEVCGILHAEGVRGVC